MATDESLEPERRSAAVTVLPTFGKSASSAEPPALEVSVSADAGDQAAPEPDQAGAPAKLPRVALLRRRSQAAPAPVITTAAPTVPLAVVEPSPPIPFPIPLPTEAAPSESTGTTPVDSAPAPAAPAPGADRSTELEAALAKAIERAESAEAANAVLRRRIAQLDDELAQFKPRTVVPFEDNVH